MLQENTQPWFKLHSALDKLLGLPALVSSPALVNNMQFAGLLRVRQLTLLTKHSTRGSCCHHHFQAAAV